ncbi:phosphoserine transaminase [Pontivivens nitratireducens]|uniref:phosphoserine transaminase n=1 Tax=Pontivivens nitratireducens TaxID=2758038 RepID=A0A6G7VM02_9RHOB|nr:phosphoserine transaminase [Pontibrevibacter nitratireducens]QIK40962.1 phosphoserine transaminase [Pontibrevibacter nitratireducens]
MSFPTQPQVKPARPEFSSGPCPKRPGWSAAAVEERAFLGRSHRAAGPKAQIKAVIDKTAELLNVPSDYVVGIVPASDTGAYEMAMWSMLGERPVDMLVWESFGKGWATDATKQLKLDDCRVIEAAYGELPDLNDVRKDADICFTQNGTTSGARIPNFDWIASDRKGLTFVDATSAVFAQPVDWSKVDVLTFSWQKVLGGEGAHGVLVLSPRAIARLESYSPDRPLPKIFRLTKGGKLIDGIFTGATINTPSMWAVADAEDALDWVAGLGATATMERAQDNYAALQYWVDDTPWIENLVANPLNRSNTSVCLKITDPAVAALDEDGQRAFVKKMVKLLETEEVAYDINGYRDAPAGLRIWCGATVDATDIRRLTPWLDWAFQSVKASM